MSKGQALRALVTERLTAAAEEIFALVERTIAEYEEELCRSKEENQRKQQLLDSVLSSRTAHRTSVQFEPGRAEEFVASSDVEEEQSGRRHDDSDDLTFIPDILVKGEDDANLSALFRENEQEIQEQNCSEKQFHFKHLEQSRKAQRTDYDSESDDEWVPSGSSPSKLQQTDEEQDDHKDDSLEKMLCESFSDGGGEQKTESHECLACGKTFKRSAELEKHMESHVSFSCPVCGKDFAREDEFKTHLSVHSGSTAFSCPECEAQFALQAHLDRHVKIHLSQAPFSCPECNKRFTRKYRLRSHMSSHTGVKAFTCPVCNRGFTRKDNLGAHMSMHTGQKPFICAVCNKCFTRKDRLTAHMTSHTGESYCLKKRAQKNKTLV